MFDERRTREVEIRNKAFSKKEATKKLHPVLRNNYALK